MVHVRKSIRGHQPWLHSANCRQIHIYVNDLDLDYLHDECRVHSNVFALPQLCRMFSYSTCWSYSALISLTYTHAHTHTHTHTPTHTHTYENLHVKWPSPVISECLRCHFGSRESKTVSVLQLVFRAVLCQLNLRGVLFCGRCSWPEQNCSRRGRWIQPELDVCANIQIFHIRPFSCQLARTLRNMFCKAKRQHAACKDWFLIQQPGKITNWSTV